MKTIKKHLPVITIIFVLITIIIILILKLKLNKTSCIVYEKPDIMKEETKKDELEKCTIDIKGAVINPGVYIVDCNKNVNDIIILSGGLTEEADTSNINLAKQITNEMVIIIYTKDENENDKEEIINNDSYINNSLININTASIDELKSIPGIGDTRAKAIVDYRLVHGNFKDIKDIINVKGIGETLYEQIKVYITT